MSTSKRKLEMLPEVLPAPVKRDRTASSVRSRTLARLEVLAAFSVTAIAASCGGRVNEDGTGRGSSGDLALPDGGTKQDCDPYCVVDPLPPPSCFDDARPPTAKATYAADADAGVADADAGADAGAPRAVVVDLDFHARAVALSSIDTLGQAQVVSQSASTKDGTATIVLRVPASASRVDVVVRVSCARGPSVVNLTLSLGPSTVEAQVLTAPR